MRTTVDIDPVLLGEAMKVSAARTKKDVIRLSLAELVRARRVDELKAMAGSLDLELDPESLDRLRAHD